MQNAFVPKLSWESRPGGGLMENMYVHTYVVRHNDITSFVTKINLENIFYVGLESSRKHNNYVFGKNKD